MITKKIIILLILISLIIIPSACTTNEPIKIGFLGTVSGPFNDLGINGKHGVDLAVKEINEAGGVNGKSILIVVKDTLNDTEIVKKRVNEFLEENVQIVIGEFTSAFMMVALEADINNEILFLSPTAAADSFVGLDDNLIRFIGSTSMQADAIFSQAQKNEDKVFAIIKNTDNTAFANPLGERFVSNIKSENGEVILEEYISSSELSKIDKTIEDLGNYENLDGLLLISDALSTIKFIQKIKDSNLDCNIYTPL